MKAVILAAGKGSRLGTLTANIPKPMLALNRETPLLEMILCGIRNAGVKDFTVITGFQKEVIHNHFGDGSIFSVNITYIHQTELNGTGGAISLACNSVGDSPFLMSFGDILIPPHNYHRLVHTFKTNPCDALLMVNPIDDPYEGAAVYFNDTDYKISKIIEKPPKGTSTSKWNNAGICIFNPILFNYLEKITLSPRGEYEFIDAIQMMIHDNRDIRALQLEGYWSDIGTPHDVQSVRTNFSENSDFLQHHIL